MCPQYNKRYYAKSVFYTILTACILITLKPSSALGKKDLYVLNGHFISYKGKPVLLVGESATQSVMQNLNLNYKEWIDDLSTKGIEAAMFWSWMAVPQKVDRSVVDRRYGYIVPDITPWARSGKGRANDGKFLWDLHQFDDRYWNRLKNFLDYSQSKEIVMVLTVFDGWPKSFWSHPFNEENGGPLKAAKDGRKQFWTLADYDHEILNEPYRKNWGWKKKNQYFQERFAEKLVQETADFTNVIYELVNEGSKNKDYDLHWIKFFKKRCSNLIAINDDYTPLQARTQDQVDVITWHSHSHEPDKLNTRWIAGFNNMPAKPIVNSETVPGFYRGFSPSPKSVRKAVWATLLAGGGIFVQDDTIFSFDPNSPQKSGTIIRDFIGYANQFINTSGIRFWEMGPHNELVSGGYCFARLGSEYLVYHPKGGAFTINLSHTSDVSNFSVLWFNPRNGEDYPAKSITGGTSHKLEPPFSGDIVLHLKVNQKL